MKISPRDNERQFRQILANKISGASAGIWLLVPELVRLGAWDIIKAWTGKTDVDIEPHIAMQLVNEAALCLNRERRKDSLGHQGFELANGMGSLVTDEQVHFLLNGHTMEQAQAMFVNLGIQRQLSGHYQGEVIAVDPHRIISTSKREMVRKRKNPKNPPQKMLQTFFSVCARTGQPIMATMTSTGIPTSRATSVLLDRTAQIIHSPSLVVADKEHFTRGTVSPANMPEHFDFLIPAMNTVRVKKLLKELRYQHLWAGYAMAESQFSFSRDDQQYRFIAQRFGETQEDYSYSGFIAKSEMDAKQLVCDLYDNRWSVDEFFGFENKMGLSRASTHNLNIRYGKLALSMIAQAATYQLRTKMPKPYKRWNAEHLSREILSWCDGDVKVNKDTIIITLYGKPKHLDVSHYVNLSDILAREGLNPKIPWLYDFKLDFRFK